MVTLDKIQEMVTNAQEEIKSARKATEKIRLKRLEHVKQVDIVEIEDALFQCPDLDDIRVNYQKLILEALEAQLLEGAKPGTINVLELLKKARDLPPPEPTEPPGVIPK
jgi:hypothetical protein